MQSHASIKAVDAITKRVIASAYVKEKNDDNIYLRVPADLKKAWQGMCVDRKISHNDAGLAMVTWIVSLPPELQAMVLGSIPAAPDVIETVMERLSESDGFVIPPGNKRVLKPAAHKRKLE